MTGQAHSMTLIAVDCIRKRRIPQNEMKMVIWSHLSRSEPLNPLTSIQSQGVECTLDEVSGAFICPSIIAVATQQVPEDAAEDPSSSDASSESGESESSDEPSSVSSVGDLPPPGDTLKCRFLKMPLSCMLACERGLK